MFNYDAVIIMLVLVLIRHGQCRFHCCLESPHPLPPLVSGPGKCYCLCLGPPASCGISAGKQTNTQINNITINNNNHWCITWHRGVIVSTNMGPRNNFRVSNLSVCRCVPPNPSLVTSWKTYNWSQDYQNPCTNIPCAQFFRNSQTNFCQTTHHKLTTTSLTDYLLSQTLLLVRNRSQNTRPSSHTWKGLGISICSGCSY